MQTPLLIIRKSNTSDSYIIGFNPIYKISYIYLNNALDK